MSWRHVARGFAGFDPQNHPLGGERPSGEVGTSRLGRLSLLDLVATSDTKEDSRMKHLRCDLSRSKMVARRRRGYIAVKQATLAAC